MRRLFLVVLAWIAGAVTLSAATPQRVEDAIVAAVRARMGERVDVQVIDLVVHVPADVSGEGVIATLAPDARFGERLRVVLRMSRTDGEATRAGSAEATVHVTRRTWVAGRALARQQEVAPQDVELRAVSLDGVRIEALPRDVRGTKATRAVAPGQILLPHMLQPVPMVRRGDQVAIAVNVGGLNVSTLGVAAMDGRLGQAIKVTNSDSGKAIVARVVGRGAVEVRHGS